MEELKETLEELVKVIKKQNTLLNKIGKALFLIPASEKEYKQIEANRRNNMSNHFEAVNELNKLITPDDTSTFDIFNIKENFNTPSDVYGDVIGDDLLEGGEF